MSCIVDFSEAQSYGANFMSGFDVMGLDSTESVTQNSSSKSSMMDGGFQDSRNNDYRYQFVEGDYEYQHNFEHEYQYDFNAGGDAVSEDAEDETIENSDGDGVICETPDGNGLVLEFFNDGLETKGNFSIAKGNNFTKGIGENTEVEYDKQSGTLSVDGQEVANLNSPLDLNNENYEIF